MSDHKGGTVDFRQLFAGGAEGAREALAPSRPVVATKRELRGQGVNQKTDKWEINLHDASKNEEFISNKLTTTKYTFLNFIPKSLFEQFRKASNFYFLIVAIITMIPGVSSFAPITAILPLLVVVGFSIAREIYDDVGRLRADNKSNNAPYKILSREVSNTDQLGETQLMKSWRIRVGDIIVLDKNDVIPADCVAVMSSEEGGVLYVSTAQLDGETNLKRHLVAQATKDITEPSQLHQIRGILTAGPPNVQLETFQGQFKLETAAEGQVEGGDVAISPVDSSNLLLRGSMLKNTEKVYALVVYTGRDTKIALNMRNPPSKMSQVDITLNYVVIYVFALLVLVVIVYAILAGYFQSTVVRTEWYLGDASDESAVIIGLRSIGTFIVLFSGWIPISLFVSLESVRVFQALFMMKDEKLRSSDGRRMIPKSSNLNDTLGLVHTILSDKTGTLTRNIMEFVACSVGGEIFDTRTDPEIMKTKAAEGDDKIKEIVLAMALCHAVVPDYHGEEEGVLLDHPNYQGQSPDEVALVKAASEQGVELRQRSIDMMTIKQYGVEETYQMMGEIEFDSDRKRMSMVFKCPDGKYKVYTKGADTTMLPRVTASEEITTKLNSHLTHFAVEGLRTLVFATKVMEEEEFTPWFKQFTAAQLAVEDRENLLARAAEIIESEMTLVGLTAVEDKLQDEVPETIEFLRNAGVALWVLTGDKRETAENIGYSAAMLDREMTVVHIEAHTEEEMGQILSNKYMEFIDPNGFGGGGEGGGIFSLKSLNSLISSESSHHRSQGRRTGNESGGQNKGMSAVEAGGKEMAIIIDGKSLQFVLNSYAKYFLQLTDHCKTVICCRVTPMQKALVVRMVKSLRGVTTLAIGDGGNDVSMIQEADVGVGLFGKEGTQAARSADYALGEFRLLKRLLCIHGHYNWVRNPGMINMSFYKNVVITMGQVYYQFYCHFSGTSIHNEYVVTVYNVALTLFNPIFFAIFEKDLDEDILLQKPDLYSANRDRVYFGKRTVLEFMLGYGLWHSIVTFWGMYGALGGLNQINFSIGREASIAVFGYGLSTQVVIIVLVKMMLMARQWNHLYILAFLVSLGAHFALVPVYTNVIGDKTLIGVFYELFRSPTFWMTTFLTCTAAFMLDFVVAMYKRFYQKDDIVLEQEFEWKRRTIRKR